MLSELKLYLISRFGSEAVNNCFYEIKSMALKTLRGVAKAMSNEQNCF